MQVTLDRRDTNSDKLLRVIRLLLRSVSHSIELMIIAKIYLDCTLNVKCKITNPKR